MGAVSASFISLKKIEKPFKTIFTMKKPHITEDEIKGIFWMAFTSFVSILIFIGLIIYLFFFQ